MEKPIEFSLKNGLKVILLHEPEASLVSVRSYVRAGSIYEEPHLGSGASHYLEHLLAGGTTTKRSEEEYKRIISHLGGAYNAYTTTDHTSYFINTIPEHTEEALNILFEWMFLNTFSDKEFNRERDVIIKEIEKNNAAISREFYRICQDNFYKYHPLRLPVIGFLETFKSLKKEDLIQYYKARYVPANMILMIGGNIHVEKIKTHIQNTFGTISYYTPPKMDVTQEPKPFSTRIVEEEGKTNVTFMSMRFSTVDLFSPELYALDLLEFILGNGEDSILYRRLVEDKKLAYSVSCTSYTPSITTGYFDISVEVDYEKRDAVKKEIESILEEIKKGKGITDKLLKRARKQKLSEDIFSMSTVEDKVSRIGQAVLMGHSIDFFGHYVRQFKNISMNDIIRVSQQYFDFNRTVVTILKPEKTEEKGSDSFSSSILPSKKPFLHRLPNGIRVLLYPDKSLPRVHAKIFTMGGIRAENKENNGIGHLLAELLGNGSEKYNKREIKDKIESNGAQMYGSLGNNTLYYNLDCLTEDFNELFSLYGHTFLKPVFSQEDLDEQKRKTTKWIAQRQDNWYEYGSYKFKKAFFSDHPYSLSTIGEKHTVSALKISDIYRHYEHLLNPETMLISIAGDFQEDHALSSVKTLFGHLKKNKSQHYFDPNAPIARPLHTKPRESHYNIPQDVVGLFIGFDGEKMNNLEMNLKLDLLDAVLSGMNYPGGRLHNILREKGLVYMVHAVHHVGIENGHFLIYALTSQDKIAEVKKIIFEQIEDVQRNPVTEEEFNQAIAQLKFFYKDRTSSIESLLLISATDELYQRGYDYYLKRDSEIERLTKEDVIETAKIYLNRAQIFEFSPKGNVED